MDELNTSNKPRPTIGDVRTERLPGSEMFDEIRITTIPRYKTSRASGDEWRFLARTEFMKKGVVLVTKETGTVGYVATHLATMYDEAHEEVFPDDENLKRISAKCQNPGCAEDATILYKRKGKENCLRCGQKRDMGLIERDTFRQFCAKHGKRGDCGVDDADDNYERVNTDGPPVEPVPAGMESPAATLLMYEDGEVEFDD